VIFSPSGKNGGIENQEPAVTAITIPDLEPLREEPYKGRVPGNKGMWVGISCEFVEFLVLFAVYFIARAHFPAAFEQGGERLSRLAGTAITLLMVTSSFFIACSVATLWAGRRRASIGWLVAAIIWLKGALIARQFIEVGLAHPFIRRVVAGFIAFTPLALLGISYFGNRVAGWASL
jgi:cytochrome c oxidase subunit 3